MMSRIEEPGSDLQRMSNQELICPVCGRGVNYHTELESVTCVNIGRITPTQHDTQNSITESKVCEKCVEQETALTQLWSIIEDRAHPTSITWRCTNCNRERQLTIN